MPSPQESKVLNGKDESTHKLKGQWRIPAQALLHECMFSIMRDLTGKHFTLRQEGTPGGRFASSLTRGQIQLWGLLL